MSNSNNSQTIFFPMINTQIYKSNMFLNNNNWTDYRLQMDRLQNVNNILYQQKGLIQIIFRFAKPKTAKKENYCSQQSSYRLAVSVCAVPTIYQ
ncbi:hypothetical protein AYI68_g6010 [Smittium mucronatum]|uniref:Uncharacterized protein n=1 Tax=Smittium mucronatum TaxID=133383 RepID=A0A1R0GST4_9FUNG|nr:hypothetical protein AYI68_g6010 [Smittium mucronatum]